MSATPPLDATLFAASPAREDRFVVKDRWRECVNLSDGHPLKTIEFLHRQMNEEVNSLEISARCLADFPEADWDLCMSIAHQCADEARHVVMFQRLFEKRGGHLWDYPVLNFQYRIITKIADLLGRLVVQNRSFEAEGIDALCFAIGDTRQQGDAELAALYEAQLADEIGHVRFANAWIRAAVRQDPRKVLHLTAALTAAAQAFAQVMGQEGTEGAKYLVNPQGRLEAGFLPEEVNAAADFARTHRPKALPHQNLLS